MEQAECRDPRNTEFPVQRPHGTICVTARHARYACKEKLVNQYVMFYLADSKQERIIILRVIHGRQDTLEILRTLEL